MPQMNRGNGQGGNFSGNRQGGDRMGSSNAGHMGPGQGGSSRMESQPMGNSRPGAQPGKSHMGSQIHQTRPAEMPHPVNGHQASPMPHAQAGHHQPAPMPEVHPHRPEGFRSGFGGRPRHSLPFGLVAANIVWNRIHYNRIRRILVEMVNGYPINRIEERTLFESFGRYIEPYEAPELLDWVDRELGYL